MPRWLFKTEPDCYSFADLQRDGQTAWDGITNALARKHLREVENDDLIWCYHTGDERAIVGLMKAVGGPRTDPNEDDPKSVVVDVKPVRSLTRPLTLAEIKADPGLADWALVRNSRLSVVPVSMEQWRRVEQLVKASRTA
jgi:predicted RNA-binding protein with PUA-like domain